MVLHQLVGDVQSYAGPDLERPGLNHALELLTAGEATCLMVAGLDRLSRSAANLGTVIEWLEEVGVRLVVIDIDLDTHTEEGRLAARALVRVGALERRSGAAVIAGAPARGRSAPGGRPAVSDLPLLQRRIADHARQRPHPPGDRRHAQQGGRPHAARGRRSGAPRACRRRPATSAPATTPEEPPA